MRDASSWHPYFTAHFPPLVFPVFLSYNRILCDLNATCATRGDREELLIQLLWIVWAPGKHFGLMSDGEEDGCGGWVLCFKTKRFYKWRTHTPILQRSMDTKPLIGKNFMYRIVNFFLQPLALGITMIYSILRNQNYCIPQYRDEIPTEHISTDPYPFRLWIFSHFSRPLLLYLIVCIYCRDNSIPVPGGSRDYE